MVEYEDGVKISVRRQCELLELSRASLYYEPIGFNEEDQRLMVAIDFEFTQTPFFGARKISKELQKKGWAVGRKRIRTLMQKYRAAPAFLLIIAPQTSQHIVMIKKQRKQSE